MAQIQANATREICVNATTTLANITTESCVEVSCCSQLMLQSIEGHHEVSCFRTFTNNTNEINYLATSLLSMDHAAIILNIRRRLDICPAGSRRLQMASSIGLAS